MTIFEVMKKIDFSLIPIEKKPTRYKNFHAVDKILDWFLESEHEIVHIEPDTENESVVGEKHISFQDLRDLINRRALERHLDEKIEAYVITEPYIHRGVYIDKK